MLNSVIQINWCLLFVLKQNTNTLLVQRISNTTASKATINLWLMMPHILSRGLNMEMIIAVRYVWLFPQRNILN